MIQLTNITKIYNKHKVLENFSLHIREKERVVLLAKSGFGKSTLLKIIAGLESIESGSIILDGKRVTDAKRVLVAPHARGVGMVFQDLALWPHLNVKENIALSLKIQNISKKERDYKVQKILKSVNLQGFERKRVDELSGGERQRVALARTLVTQPKIILMDEPLSSLDDTLNVQIREEIVKLQEYYNFTLLYVTHNKQEAEYIATRIVRL